MDMDRFYFLIERLRKQAIGKPERDAEKDGFEYSEQSAKVVAVLKLVRAAHGVSALHVLWRNGSFIDFGAILRCINDCTDEIYFLLENPAEPSGHVGQFVKAFFETTIDGYEESKTHAVEKKVIRNAAVRVIAGRYNYATQQRMEKAYKAFSGYVHANYAHTMEVYNGGADDFNLRGVPSGREREKREAYLDVMANSVLLAAAFVAQTLGMREDHAQLMKTLVDV